MDFPKNGKAPLLEGPASSITVSKGFRGLDLVKIRELVESSFGKVLVPGYFDAPAESVVLEDSYRGLAVIKLIGLTPYLDKFAVEPSSQGTGLGKKIWNEINGICSSLIWRAVSDNPINGWYKQNSDGSQEIGKWVVFWYNLDAAPELITAVSKRPETLVRQEYQGYAVH